MKYVIVSPVRNEEKYLPFTIKSLVAQTIKPALWIVVNDGSTDRTGQIAEEAAQSNSWIKVVNRADRGFRQAGGGVVEAFYEGYYLIEKESWDYVIKLDGDLSFGPDYFEQCFARFDEDQKLGIAGGTICAEIDGVLEAESKNDPMFHVRGATKIYRQDCWRAIGGLIHAPGGTRWTKSKRICWAGKRALSPMLKLFTIDQPERLMAPGMTGSKQAWPITSPVIIPCSCSLNACGAWAKSLISSAVGGCCSALSRGM